MQPNSSPSLRTAERGFTLIEILLAIAIAAVVVTVVNTTFFESHRIVEQVDDQTRTYQMARTALDRLARDLSCAYVPLARPFDETDFETYGFDGQHATDQTNATDRLSFSTAATLGFGQSYGTARVAYFLKPMDDSQELYYLMRREYDRPSADTEQNGSLMELAENVVSLQITYLETSGSEQESWSLESKLRLPPQVRIKLTVRNGKESMPFSATVSLPLSSGELASTASTQGSLSKAAANGNLRR